MVIAVIAMRKVKTTVDDIADVVPVRDGFVTAVRAVNMAWLMASAGVLRGTSSWILLANF